MTPAALHQVLRQAEHPPADAPDGDLVRRFAAGRDESAFAELVRRHGPMVWAACRHLLPGHADAEDAFQVTFLALARSAGSIRRADAVGGWLHGVAVRAATKLKRSAARRRAREHRAAGGEADRSIPATTWDALLAAVHEEVQRLPGPLRTAFVLCDLEGVRQPDAAARLGWKPGTLTGRLARARQLLLVRLVERGVAPAAGVAIGLGMATAAGAVPAGLVGRVVELSRPGGVVPPAVSELLREVTPMTLNGTMRVAVMALMVGGLGAALFPLAQAQPPGGFGAAEPVPAPFVAPADATGTPAAAPVWVYKYVEQRREAAAFKKTVSDLGAAGWEYCDHLELDRKATPRGDEVNDMLVFKRPGAAARPPMGNAPVLPAGPGAKGGPPTADELVVFKAKHVRAADVAKTLREVFGVAGGVVEITADERTNSLIVHGSPRVINGVRELLLVLDTPPADPNVPGPKR